MSRQLRLFIAVELDRGICRGLEKVQAELRRAGGTVKWVDYRAMHLTLKFLGETEAELVPKIHTAVVEAVEGFAPFQVSVAGVGAFGPVDAPHVIWAGIEDGAETLVELAAAVEAGLHQGLGFPPERRPFSPHVTLGRLRQHAGPRRSGAPRRPPANLPPRVPTPGENPEGLPALIQSQAETRFGEQEVTELVIFMSELTRTGPIYTPMAHVELGG